MARGSVVQVDECCRRHERGERMYGRVHPFTHIFEFLSLVYLELVNLKRALVSIKQQHGHRCKTMGTDNERFREP